MLGAWCPTPRPVRRPQQTIRHAFTSTPKKLGFEQDKGQLREWMTVARDRSAAWALKVEYKLGTFLPAHLSPQALKDTNDKLKIVLIKLAETVLVDY
jgi:hypothetical protein